MNIFWTCKTASRGCMALAIIALLFASAAALPDDDKKDKKKDSNAAKPAPVQKAPAAGGQPKGSGSGRDGAANAPARTRGDTNTTSRSGGTSTGANTGGTSTRTNTGGTSTRTNTGGTTTTNKTGETNSTDKAARRSGKSDSTNNAGKPAETGTTNKAGETSTTDKAARRSGKSDSTNNAGKTAETGTAIKTRETTTTDKAERRGAKSDPTNTTGKTAETGTANKTRETSTTDKAERRGAKGEATTTGKTGDTGTANKTRETSTTDKADRRGGKSDSTNNAGKTAETGTAIKTRETTTTDKADRRGAKSDATNTTGKTGVTSTTGKNTTGRPVITRTSDGKPDRFRGRDGSEARFRRDGTVREVQTRDMTIIHGPSGSRRVVVERVDHSRVVAYRGGRGYVQRPFVYRGHEFAGRTYFYHGRPYAQYYQRYPYRGVFLEGYRPYRYYGRSFYGWAYNPWRSPVRYSWGWAGNPWYGYYGGYFTPYASYPSASFWLTDYLIAASLQAAYQQRLDSQATALAPANSDSGVVLTPEVKQAIADEVQRQLALENSESQTVAGGGDVDINSSGLPRIFAETSPNHPHVFVVASPLEVTDAAGQDCDLSEGDVLRLSNAPPPDATSASLQVFASKNQSCRRGTMVSVGLADLQEMQNHMRASIDQGLQELQAHPNGLPAPPPASATLVQASFAQIAPPADPNVANELQQQAREADTAEQGVLEEVKQEDNSGGVQDPSTPSKNPIRISLGQTIGEVVAALGTPTQVVDLGSKKIYVYPDLKITFIDGRVTDVQ